MKRVFFTILQFVLFLLTFAVGSFLPAFQLLPKIATKFAGGTRLFLWDGVLLMIVLLAVILIIEVVRKRLRTAAVWTGMAFVLATLLGLAMKLGFMDA
jgi:uncharacterized BrkB/YihY/UPF0761 family membrane protein